MKQIGVILAFFFLSLAAVSPLGAQRVTGEEQVPYQDVVYLRDGSILRGKLVSWDYGQPLTLRLLGGQEVTIPDAEIEKVRQELTGTSRNYTGHRFRFREEGMYHLFGLSFPVGSELGISLTYSLGHRFSRYLSVGGGFGYEDMEINWSSQLIPVFLETRGYLSKGKLSPYYSLRAGLGFPLKNENYNITETRPGILLNPEIGYRFGGRDVHFYMGIGYRLQKARYTIEPDWWEERQDIDRLTFRRLDIKFGLDF